MCKSLGVKMLPYFHLYRGQRGKLSQFTASISKVQRLRDAIAKNTGDAWDPNGERRHDSDVAEELSALVNGEASRVESDPDAEPSVAGDLAPMLHTFSLHSRKRAL